MAHVTNRAGTNISFIRKCATFPPLVNSGGAFDDLKPLEASLPRLELHIFCVFMISYAFNSVLKRFGIPIFISHCLAGIFLGTTGLGQQTDYRKFMYTFEARQIFETISAFGYQLYMFQMGVKMDLSLVTKTEKKALYCGVLSMVIPLLLGATTIYTLSAQWGLDRQGRLELFLVMIVHTMTPFPVIFGLLSDLEIVNTELGRLGLSSASVSDSITLFLALLGFLRGIAYLKGKAALINLASVIMFILTVLFAVRPAMVWVIKRTPDGRPVKEKYLNIIILGAMASGLLTNLMGLHLFLGAAAIGMAVPTGPPLASALVERLECAVSGVLMPLFVAMCTMRIDLLDINFDDKLLKGTAIVLVVVIIAKFVACLVPLLLCNLPKRNATALALLMSSKGIIELASYTYIREVKGMTDGMFAFAVLIILLTTTIASILLNLLYNPSRQYAGYQKRSLMHNNEIRILACIVGPDNVASMINFLEASCSNAASLVSVDVLHLIKLVGRASPIFISHHMQPVSQYYSYSENLIRSFSQLQIKNVQNLAINIFTAISPPKFMHEDICMLAFNKLTSFIVLPFYQKWHSDGSIESEDISLRTLNCTVLKNAPCSVGILIDRGNLGTISFKSSSKRPSLLVAMLFIGGRDDREALVFAKRMAHHRSISLTVIRFIASDTDGGIDSDELLDSEALRDVYPDECGNQNVNYMEEKVIDGLDTARIIRSLVNKYNLFIVGRREDIEIPQTSGLGEFSEYPELGIVGSLVTSMDITERYSVLVVQQ